MIPTAQPEQSDKVVFWKKRAKEYEDIILSLVAEQAKGVKFDSIEITEEGIRFKKSKPERKKGKWIVHYECPKCGEITKDFMEYCPFCGADMRERNEDE